MILYGREKEEFLSLFKAGSGSENDLSALLFEVLLDIVNKNNIDALEVELLKQEGVTTINDLPTQYRVYGQDLKDFITEEE